MGVALLGGGLGIAAVASLAGPAAAQPDPPGGALIVNNGSYPDQGALPTACASAAYSSIQAAVNAATSGQTVYVCAGTYDENVTISIPLSLDGAEYGIDAVGRSAAPETNIDSAGGITYATGATSGTVSGFDLTGYTGSGAGEIQANPGLQGVGSNWTFTDDIVDASHGGIGLNTDGITNPAATTISDDEFTQATPASESGGGWAGQAVTFWGGSANNVSIDHNDFLDLSGPGGAINTTGSGSVSAAACASEPSLGLAISDNTFEENGTGGTDENQIVLFCTSGASITGNNVTITDAGDANAETAFYVGGGDVSATLSGNTLNGNGATAASAIKVNTAFYATNNPTVDDNTISGWGLRGIMVYGGSAAVNGCSSSCVDSYAAPAAFTIEGNDITGSGANGAPTGDGVLLSDDGATFGGHENDPSGGTISGNAVQGSTSFDYQDQSSGGSGTDGTDNSWSDNIGSTSSPSGLAGKASTSVSTLVDNATTQTAWTGALPAGSSADDTSTVGGEVAGVTPTGTVSYSFYNNAECLGAATSEGSGLALGTHSNATGAITTLGYYGFEATYSGDSNYSSSTSACEVFVVGRSGISVVTPADLYSGTGSAGCNNVAPTGPGQFNVIDEGACPSGGGISIVGSPGQGGVGSLQLSVTGTADHWAAVNYDDDGASLADLTTLSYSTFTTNGAPSTDPILQVVVDPGAPSAAGSAAGCTAATFSTLDVEPYLQPAGETDGAWQSWNVVSGAEVWGTHLTNCAPASRLGSGGISWATLVSYYPNAVISGGVGVDVGSGWSAMTGNVGSLTIATGQESDAFVFNPSAPSTSTVSAPTNATIAWDGGGNTDGVTVSGDSALGSPTGSVTYYTCDEGVSPCTLGTGSQLGSPVTVTAAANNTGTATSPTFTPSGPPGTWCFAAVYSGDSNYAGSSDQTSDECFTVTRATPTIPQITNLPASGTFGGSSGSLTVSTNGDGTTSITSSTLSQCTVSGFTVNYVGTGTCTLTAHVAQGTDYNAADGTGQSFQVVTVGASSPSISNLPASGTFGGSSGTLTVSTNGDGTTSITSSTLSQCTVSGFIVNYVGAGTCTLTAHVAAGVDFGAADGNPQSFQVGKAPTATATQSGASPSAYDQPVTFTATVAPNAPATSTPTGTVSFALADPAPTKGRGALPALTCVGGNIQTLTGGSATCSVGGLALTQSPVSVVATYSGDANYTSSVAGTFTQTVDRGATSVTVTSSNIAPLSTGDDDRFTATVADPLHSGEALSGSVSFTFTGRDGTTVTCPNPSYALNRSTDQASCHVPRWEFLGASGPYTASATYSGNTNFAPSTGTLSLPVTPRASRTGVTVTGLVAAGSATSFTATAKTPLNGPDPTGSVTFTIAATGATAPTCTGGDTVSLTAGSDTATCQLPVGLAKVGSPYQVTAEYLGDGNYQSSTSPTKVVRAR